MQIISTVSEMKLVDILGTKVKLINLKLTVRTEILEIYVET